MLLNVRQVADLLAVSRQCVYTLVDDGQLAHIRVGFARRCIRIHTKDVIGFIDECKVKKRPESRSTRVASTPAAFRYLNGVKLRKAWVAKGIFPHD